MIWNYLKITLRSLWSTRGYSFLNVFGLAVGIAAASLIFLWIDDEVGYDDHFLNKEHIYSVKSTRQSDGNVHVYDAVSGLLGPAIKEEIPGIRHAARANWSNSYLFTIGENGVYQTGHVVDPEFMDIFSLEFVAGSRATAMNHPNSIVVTDATARRLFGEEAALGKSILVNGKENFIVSGVVKDLPQSSSIRFDWLIAFEGFERDNAWVRDWDNAVILTYVQLEPSADLAGVNSMLYDFVKVKSGNDQQTARNFLYPMERWRLYNSFDNEGNEQAGRLNHIRMFGLVAWVVLLIACINFMNLTTARSERRAKEVGMRKVVGATKGALVRQFLGESLILASASALLAIFLVYISIDAFSGLVEKELSLDLFRPAHFLFLFGMVLVCGILSGSYPAFYLSAFNPIKTLSGAKRKAGAAGFVRRGLVVLQYTASIILVICTVVIYQQIQHAKVRDLGFDLSQVISVPLRGDAVGRIEIIREQLLATGNVEHIGLSSGDALNVGVRTDMDWAGKAPGSQVDLWYMWADGNFVPAMGMELLDGRTFRPDISADSSGILINEAFAKLIVPDGRAAGQTVYWEGDPHIVLGVVKDFVYNNVYSLASPVFFRPFDLSGGTLSIRTKAGADLVKTVAQVEQVIKAHNPGYPFDYRFLDEVFDEKFGSELLIQKLAGIFAMLSIVISCLGLFGLAAFSAQRRTKELGIRKVLGASASALVGLLNREFIVLVFVSCAVAFPVAWWIMNDWLTNYQYRTELHWWVFALTGFSTLAIALLTVSSQALSVALINPTKSLRDE